MRRKVGVGLIGSSTSGLRRRKDFRRNGGHQLWLEREGYFARTQCVKSRVNILWNTPRKKVISNSNLRIHGP